MRRLKICQIIGLGQPTPEAQETQHLEPGRVAALRERMAQIPGGKHGQTKNSTPEIDVMTDTVRRAPMHPRQQVEGLGEMSKHDHHQTSYAE